MVSRMQYIPQIHRVSEAVPFENAQEAWFWFVQAQEAKNEGARFTAGLGLCQRPCEPLDILKILERLYRQRRLLMDHLKVLRHYGRRKMPPDPYRVKEARAYKIWSEALERLEPCFERKGIVKKWPARPVWQQAELDMMEAGLR